MRVRVYHYPGLGYVGLVKINGAHVFVGLSYLEEEPVYFKHRNQLLHVISEIQRNVRKDFHTNAPLPPASFGGQRPRPRSKTRRKYGFYRIHKESLERSKGKSESD